MDKITHQVRAEHWAKIMNECINSGMSKTAWCRANGISEKQFFYWQMNILVREYRCSGGTDTANPAAGNRCSGTEIPHLIDCLLPASLLA